MQTVTYNGVSVATKGGIVLEVSPPVRAARRIESVVVPGRSGVLHIDDGSYAPIKKTVRIGVNAPDRIDGICAWCARSGVLQTSHEPGVAYKAVQAAEIRWERISRRLHQAEIVFECEPYRYLHPAAANIVLVAPGNVTNPGTASAAPLYVVEGSGDITLTVGGQIVTLTGITTGITLDSDMGLAYTGITNMSAHMSGDFPALLPGVNAISWVGSVTSITITPRWRYL